MADQTAPPTRRVDELIPLAAQAALDAEVAEAHKKALRAELCAAALWVQEVTGTKPTLRHDDATISLTVPEGGLGVRGDGQEYLGWRAQRKPGEVQRTVTLTIGIPVNCSVIDVMDSLEDAVVDVLTRDGVTMERYEATSALSASAHDLAAEHEALVDDGRLVAVYDRVTGEEVPGLKWNPPGAPYVSVRPTAAAKARATEATS